MLKRIGTAARKDLEMLTGGKVFLKLFVKVRKDWRDNDMLLKDYGYEKKKELNTVSECRRHEVTGFASDRSESDIKRSFIEEK